MNHLFESINILPTAKRPNAQFGIAIVHPTQWEKALNQYENYKSIYRNYNWCFKSLKHFETLWEYTACPACKYATDTILISALCKRGQAGNIQNPQRHLSSKNQVESSARTSCCVAWTTTCSFPKLMRNGGWMWMVVWWWNVVAWWSLTNMERRSPAQPQGSYLPISMCSTMGNLLLLLFLLLLLMLF